jgi:hypothetical protein
VRYSVETAYQRVGWVERSDTHQPVGMGLMDIAALNPSYGLREPATLRECSTFDSADISSSLPVTDLSGPLALAKNQIHMLGARTTGSSANLKLTKAPCNQRRQCLPSDLSLSEFSIRLLKLSYRVVVKRG